MNELLGILIPMLMSGAGIGDILRTVGGMSEGGAGRYDGLKGISALQMQNVMRTNPLKPDQSSINNSIEMVVDRLGVNPYKPAGQGLASFMGSMYHLAPDIMGTILGIPNSKGFFQSMATGASGINYAAGYGMADPLNPYSVKNTYDNAMKLGRTVYSMGVNQDQGGYNISYSHGLNAGEMGKVAQRLLSSNLPYMEYDENGAETGRRLDPNDKETEDKFKDNLKKLGSKFNETVSMLSKITGSVDEAIRLMDRLGGGNFLGGTAEQASQIANRARKMAASVRITAALGGMSPQEAFANMSDMQKGMAAATGADAGAAKASGYTATMFDMAYHGTMAYSQWLAKNPNASEEEKERAMLGARGRTLAYASSSAADMAAAFADNASLFSDEERKRVIEAYRRGNANDVRSLVVDKLGVQTFNSYMNDPAVRAAARMRAYKENPDLIRETDMAGIEGNLYEAEEEGVKMVHGNLMDDFSIRMMQRTGKSGFSDRRREDVQKRLAEIAVSRNIFTKEGASKMSVEDLTRSLEGLEGLDKKTLDMIKRTEEINSTKRQIDENTMSDGEERAAKDRLKSEIDKSNLSDREKARIKSLADEKGLDSAFDEYTKRSGMDEGKKNDLNKTIKGNKLSKEEAELEKKRFDRDEKSNRTEKTFEDAMESLENAMKDQSFRDRGALKSMMKGEDFEKLSTKEKMERFEKNAIGLAGRGVVDLGKGENGEANADLGGAYAEAASSMMDRVFGGSLGSMSGEEFEDLKKKMSSRFLEGMKGGRSIDQSLEDALENLTPDEIEKIGGGDKEKGKERVKKYIDSIKDKDSRLYRENILTEETFFADTVNVVERNTNQDREKAFADLKARSRNFVGTDKEMTDLIDKTMRKIGVYGEKGEALESAQKKGLSEILSGEGSLSGLSEEEVGDIAKGAAARFGETDGGDYQRAMVEELRDRANAKGVSDERRDQLNKAADELEKRNDIGRSMMESMVKAISGGKDSVDATNASFGSAGINKGLIANAAANSPGLQRMKVEGISEGMVNTIGRIDDKEAEKQNSVANAWAAGDRKYASEAVESTKKRIADLGKYLSDNNLKETVSEAFGSDKEKAASAMKKLEEDFEKNRPEAKQDIATLKSMYDKGKIAGKDWQEVLYTGEKDLDKMIGDKDGKARGDVLDVARGTARRESGTYEIMDKVGNIIKDISAFLNNPVAALTQKGPINVNVSNPDGIKVSLW